MQEYLGGCQPKARQCRGYRVKGGINGAEEEEIGEILESWPEPIQ